VLIESVSKERSSMKRFSLLVTPLLIVVLVFAAVGCGDDEASPTPTQPPVVSPTATQPPATQTLTLGVTAPMAGPLAWTGENIVGGMKLAAEDINAAGGIQVGGETYMLEIVFYDDQYNGDQAAANVRRMMEQGIKYMALMGTVHQTAAAPITEPAKIIAFTGSNVINPEHEYIFRTNASPTSLAVQYTLEYAKDAYPELARVAILNNDSESGRAIKESEIETAESLGFEVVFSDLHELSTTDFYPYLTTVVGANPDIIDTGASSPAGGIATFVRILDELGWQGKISASLAGPSFAPGSEGLAITEGVFGYMPQDPESEFLTDKEKDLWQRFSELYPDTNVFDYCFSYYEAVDGLAQAIEKAGTLDTTAVRDTWADLEWESARGTLKFGGEETFGIKRQIIGPIAFGEVIDGKVVEGGRIWPEWP